jgi:hypothetical protein
VLAADSTAPATKHHQDKNQEFIHGVARRWTTGR